MKLITSLVSLVITALLQPGQTHTTVPQFSADVRVWNKLSSVSHMKMFVGNKRARLDRQPDLSGYHSIQSLIVDSDAHSVFLLIPEKKSYVESTKLAADLSHGASIFRPRDPANPCAEWIEWVRKYHDVELRCRKLGEEMIDGRKTQKWEGSATPEGGWGNIWFDPELRFVIKLRSYPKKGLLEGYDLQQIEEGPQPDTLFELPNDYVRMSLADFTSFDSGNRARNR
jgi:hypothetical protein